MSNENGHGFVNDKYSLLKGKEEDPELVFFNYHEFLAPTQDSSSSHPALVINHFPNYFADKSSSTFRDTRVVRIPRCYDNNPYSDLTPQFSTIYPGQEAGAIKLEEHGEVTTGLYDGGVFGTTSDIIGFKEIISEGELFDIIDTINRMLYDAFYPFRVATLIENIMEVLTGGLFISIMNLLRIRTFTKRKVLELEQYVENVNVKLQPKDVTIVSPRKMGYLSICIVYVPKVDTNA